MAKYMIEHTCGHDVEMHLFGPEKERASKIAWLEKQPCLSCSCLQERHEAFSEAESLSLVELTGSEKQVAWALRLRSEFITQMKKRLADGEKKLAASRQQTDTLGYTIENGYAAILRAVNHHNEAKWWIDHRDSLTDALNAEYRKELEMIHAR